jgi:hypothetical protein
MQDSQGLQLHRLDTFLQRPFIHHPSVSQKESYAFLVQEK